MKNIQGWAVAAVMMVVAGCTTEATTGSDGGATSAASGGSAGAAGSTTTSSGAGGSATGGSGGSGDDGGVCAARASAMACEKCSFALCMTETCACMGNADCKGAIGDFWGCLSDADGGDIGDCTVAFSIAANGDMVGGGFASRLATCMNDCDDRCKGRDGGPRR